ncbi:hypothetical protein S58_03220 [Bradyrhizobium oligotrophicum S58]|uniref:Uncharacterized protein n=1 Tax=Bradyrhizobium oligotrophicum S58 TaxID=1245469 RepID=M4Z0C6_9BRAD|nr:hypothetical protein S58_03220 [Bradyrhizobium oligotrophicum S58]
MPALPTTINFRTMSTNIDQPSRIQTMQIGEPVRIRIDIDAEAPVRDNGTLSAPPPGLQRDSF